MIVQHSAVFCPSVQYLSFFCEAFSGSILDSSSFSLFHSGQVFQELVCPLTVVLPKIFSNLTALFSYPVFFCLFHASLDVVVHFPVVRRFFRFNSFLSQFSPSAAQIKNFCSDPGFFLLTMFAKDSLAVLVTAVLKVVIIKYRSVSSLFMTVRGQTSLLS